MDFVCQGLGALILDHVRTSLILAFPHRALLCCDREAAAIDKMQLISRHEYSSSEVLAILILEDQIVASRFNLVLRSS